MKYALTAKHSVLFMHLSLIGCRREYFEKAIGIQYELQECLIREDELFWNYDNDQMFNKAFLKNKTLNQALYHFITSLSKAANELEKTAEAITQTKKWQTSDMRKLNKILIEYIDKYLLMMPFLFQFWNVEHLLLKQLNNDFEVIFGKKRSALLLQRVLTPIKDTYFSMERRSLEQILLYICDNKQLQTLFKQDTKTILRDLEMQPDLKQILDRHLVLYAFTTTNLQLGKPLTLAAILERLKQELKPNTKEIISSRDSQSLSDRESILKVLQSLAPFPDIYERVLLAQELIFWRNQRLDVPSKSDFLIKPLFEKIAGYMLLSYEEFVWLTYDEIQAWFADKNKLPTKSVIATRRDHVTMYLKKRFITLTSERADYPIVNIKGEKLLQHKVSKPGTTILRGTAAYRGKVVGKIRLVITKADIHRVQEGEILVTSMTRPEMILGLEKAAAFVTDQGGLLSHAAIVSRELKKPCIIGTQNATSMLKTGDLVAVDAYKGIITKLT